MEQIPIDTGISMAFDAIVADRLAVLLGAGLSMAPPSCLPSAASLAARAKAKYDARYGHNRAPLAPGIEDQAQFFFERGELATVYFRTLIDFDAFAGQPNPGHEAIADLLLTGAIQTGITTNVDCMVEAAGQLMFGQIAVGIDGLSCAALPADRSPLLKIHGCRTCDPNNMVWAPGQIAVPPVSTYIASSSQWLGVRLLHRDLLVVGYWTDWDYLNDVLAQTLGQVAPARVIVVDPAPPATFAAKAPVLFALGEANTANFFHVQASGADFLGQLRIHFSESYIRQILHGGSSAFFDQTGDAANPAWLEPPAVDNESFWRMRRDLEGRKPTQPARQKVPDDEPLLGMTLLQLRAAGAAIDGPYWILSGRRIRVLRSANTPLQMIEAQFRQELAPVVAPDIIIAVGAEGGTQLPDIVRGRPAATIARGSSSRWLTRTQAVEALGL
jgi:hypothetical protein